MKIYVICHVHKEVLCLGDTFDTGIRHHAVDSSVSWSAFGSFAVTHCHCQCVLVAEREYYDMELIGYRRKDNAYGIPFKGPEELGL